jgi:DNA-binding transcriptional MocR family regulator
MALAKPGDQVLTDTMTSPAIRSIAAMLNLRLKPVAMDERGMIPDDLEEKLKQNDCKAVYLIPNFHNPTASIMPLERRMAIAEIAERFGLYLVEDDVFGSLIETRIKPPLLGQGLEGRTCQSVRWPPRSAPPSQSDDRTKRFYNRSIPILTCSNNKIPVPETPH